MKIKGAIFDMDGTLVDSLGFWEDFWVVFGKKYLNEEGFIVPKDMDKRVRTMILEDVVDYLIQYFKLSVSHKELIDYINDSVKVYYREQVVTKKGVVEFLDYLKGLNIQLAVASASQMEYIRIALEKNDLAKYFDVRLTCADLGVGKDKPDVYIATMQQMGLKAEEVCVFEDSFVAIETAKKLGCKTVGIFDKNNFGHDRLRASSDMYLDDGMQMKSLIGKVEKG